MKVYIGIGTELAQLAPSYVLKKTLHKFGNSLSLSISNLNEEKSYVEFEEIKGVQNATTFSFQRFFVPSIAISKDCDVAIYLDSDIVCLGDFEEALISFFNSEYDIAVASPRENLNQGVQTAVMFFKVNSNIVNKFDQLIRKIPNLHRSDYAELMHGFLSDFDVIHLSSNYNSRDQYDNNTVFLHYTDLYTQPWVSIFRKERDIWLQLSDSLYRDDAIYKKILDKGIEQKFYLKSLNPNSSRPLISDLYHLPPVFRYHPKIVIISRYVPEWVLGFGVQFVSLVRSLFSLRFT